MNPSNSEPLDVTNNSRFNFATQIDDLQSYNVSILNQAIPSSLVLLAITAAMFQAAMLPLYPLFVSLVMI